MSLEPGGAALITITVDVPEVLMKKIATCTIETDDPERKVAEYSLQFTSLPAVVAEPSEITVEKSEFANAETVVKSVSLISFDRFGSDDVESILANGVAGVQLASVDVREEEDLGDKIVKRSRIVRFSISAKAYEDHAASKDVISLTSPDAKLRFRLPIFFREPGDSSVHPSFVNFGLIGDADRSTRFATVRVNLGPSSIDDVSLDSDSDVVQASIEATDGVSARITLNLNSARLRPDQRKSSTAVAGAVQIRLRGALRCASPGQCLCDDRDRWTCFFFV